MFLVEENKKRPSLNSILEWLRFTLLQSDSLSSRVQKMCDQSEKCEAHYYIQPTGTELGTPFTQTSTRRKVRPGQGNRCYGRKIQVNV